MNCRFSIPQPKVGTVPVLALCIACVMATGAGRSEEAASLANPLPEGPNGIAAKCPSDRDIEKHPDVLFAERFDAASLDVVFLRWDNVTGKPGMALSSDVPEGAGDRKSLLLTHVGGKGTGGHLYRRLAPGFPLVFARFYVKFDPDCAPIHHFGTHLGGLNPLTPWPQGGAGERPRGDDRFTVGIEPYGKNWNWGFYTYWQGMHVHGDGKYWGTPFLTAATQPKVEKGKWICVEMMVKMNDPVDACNGEQAFWIDGSLWKADGQVLSHLGKGFPKGGWTGGWWKPDSASASAFEGFQWRTTDKLSINYVWAYLYITQAPKGHVSKVWFDNIVVAKSYIGPIQPGK
jgi:hypothetical protein